MASRNLGSLTIDLVAKTGGFTAGLSKAERELDSRGKRMNAIAKKIGTGIGAAISAGVVAGGVLATSLKVSIDRMDDLSKAAQRAQLPTEQFSQLAYAGQLADVEIEELVKAFGKLTKAQGDAARGLSTQVKAFKDLGIDAIDPLTGKLRSTREVFLDFADAFQKNKGQGEIQALGMEVFGRSFQKLIPLLKDGRAGLEAAADEADRLGFTLSTETGQQAEAFNDNLTRLKTAILGLSQSVAADLLPELVRLTDQFVAWSKEGDTAEKVSGAISTAVSFLGEQIQAAAKDFEFFIDTLRDLKVWIDNTTSGLGNMGQVIGRVMVGDLQGAMASFRQAQQQADAAYGAIFEGAANFSTVSGTRANFRNVSSAPADFSNVNQPIPESPNLRISGPAAKAGKKALSEEEKAAEQLKRAYESLTESMRERIALFGEETEVAKVTYEIQQGSLKALDEASKQSLLTQAAELDALRERQEIEEEGKRLIEGLLQPFEQVNAERKRAVELLEAGVIAQEDYNRAIAALKTPAEEMLEDMLFEIELLGKTREEQELLTAARYLGAEAATAQGQAALAAMQDLQRAAKENAEIIEFADGMRDAFGDFFTDMIDGSKSAKEAFRDLVGDILAQITRLMVNRAIEQLFGAYGSAQGGQSGVNWGQILGSLFGGGRANGGNVNPFSMVEVNERGFETASVGGRQYLLAGDSPIRITPNNMLGGGGLQQTNNLVVQGRVTRRTEERMAQLTGREARRALARTGH